MMEMANAESSLLEQGTLNFNLCNIKIAGRTIEIMNSSTGMSDAYNVKRYNNVTDFSANTHTGTDITDDISNRSSGKVIPAGATCTFSATLQDGGQVSATYQYIAVLLRNTGTGNIQRIGAFGQNKPSTSVTWISDSDVEIGCIALEYSHFRYNVGNPPYDKNIGTFELSLIVNGEEWL